MAFHVQGSPLGMGVRPIVRVLCLGPVVRSWHGQPGISRSLGESILSYMILHPLPEEQTLHQCWNKKKGTLWEKCWSIIGHLHPKSFMYVSYISCNGFCKRYPSYCPVRKWHLQEKCGKKLTKLCDKTANGEGHRGPYSHHHLHKPDI